MNKKFVKPSDPILQKIAKEINPSEIDSIETKEAIKSMFSVAFGEQQDFGKPLMVGLAAPQIGISKRIVLVDVAANGKGRIGDLRVFINPEITWSSSENQEWYEGCYSTNRVCGIVERPKKIKIKALDQSAEKIEGEYDGYTARIFQHEIDHLNGKEFVVHIKDPKNLHWVEEEEFPEYRNNEGWRNWPKKCSFDKWKRIKGA